VISRSYGVIEYFPFFLHRINFPEFLFFRVSNRPIVLVTRRYPTDLMAALSAHAETHMPADERGAFGLEQVQAHGARLAAIIKYCWNEKQLFFTDYNWTKKSLVDQLTAAGLVPLFIVENNNSFIKSKADHIAGTVTKHLLQPGGLATTTIASGQQWDWPNGWAPLQWMAVKGLQKFGKENMARTIAQNWVSLNEKVFVATGKMMEKYDVVDTTKLAGGGEYESQEGFGWTNGVYLALKNLLSTP